MLIFAYLFAHKRLYGRRIAKRTDHSLTYAHYHLKKRERCIAVSFVNMFTVHFRQLMIENFAVMWVSVKLMCINLKNHVGSSKKIANNSFIWNYWFYIFRNKEWNSVESVRFCLLLLTFIQNRNQIQFLIRFRWSGLWSSYLFSYQR